jgi:putative FmdB family regulatory protein
MPLYDYLCSNCGAEKEMLMKNFEEAENTFPICECQAAMVRQVSPAGLSFKGSGWSQDYTPRARKDSKGSNRWTKKRV